MTTFRLRYTAIEVTNLERSIQFYTGILGMNLVRRVQVPETFGEFGILKTEGSDHWLEVNWYGNQQQYRAGDGLDHLAFEVGNLDTALAELKTKGIEPVSYIRDTPRARWTYIGDPDGIWVELFQKKEQG